MPQSTQLLIPSNRWAKHIKNLTERIVPCCSLIIPWGACKYIPWKVTKADGVFLLQEHRCTHFSMLNSAALLFPVSKIWSRRQGNLNPFSMRLSWGMWITYVLKCYKTLKENNTSTLSPSSSQAASSLVLKTLCHGAVTQRKPVWVQSHFSWTYWLRSKVRRTWFRPVAVQLFLQCAHVSKAFTLLLGKQHKGSGQTMRFLPVIRPFSNISLHQLLHLQLAPVLYNFSEVSSIPHWTHHPAAET